MQQVHKDLKSDTKKIAKEKQDSEKEYNEKIQKIDKEYESFKKQLNEEVPKISKFIKNASKKKFNLKNKNVNGKLTMLEAINKMDHKEELSNQDRDCLIANYLDKDGFIDFYNIKDNYFSEDNKINTLAINAEKKIILSTKLAKIYDKYFLEEFKKNTA